MYKPLTKFEVGYDYNEDNYSEYLLDMRDFEAEMDTNLHLLSCVEMDKENGRISHFAYNLILQDWDAGNFDDAYEIWYNAVNS